MIDFHPISLLPRLREVHLVFLGRGRLPEDLHLIDRYGVGKFELQPLSVLPLRRFPTGREVAVYRLSRRIRAVFFGRGGRRQLCVQPHEGDLFDDEPFDRDVFPRKCDCMFERKRKRRALPPLRGLGKRDLRAIDKQAHSARCRDFCAAVLHLSAECKKIACTALLSEHKFALLHLRVRTLTGTFEGKLRHVLIARERERLFRRVALNKRLRGNDHAADPPLFVFKEELNCLRCGVPADRGIDAVLQIDGRRRPVLCPDVRCAAPH